ncbi:MAG: response regulator transcription factor [Prosthecobacter sp.]|jgi:DNA-binding NarL/FixJ family response regulator|nr:response regulator transcription factor [Prosthecobacter sp.]
MEALQLRDLHKPELTVVCAKHGEDLALVRELGRARPKTRVLVVAHHAEPTQVQRALKAGALGYVMLEDEEAEVLRALMTVMAGGVHVSQRAMRGLQWWLGNPAGMVNSVDALSDRELEIYHLIADGVRTKEIAYMLNISVKTVETHKQRMKEKLNLRTCAELNRHACLSAAEGTGQRRRG